jgi:hypothetical protein
MLFRSQPMGAMRLDHGVVMAPLTRYRSTNVIDYVVVHGGSLCHPITPHCITDSGRRVEAC